MVRYMKSESAFFICPLKEENSKERERSKYVLDIILKPILKDRFDIGRSVDLAMNFITHDIAEQIKKSTLTICDISDSNPNVLYELGVRHMTGKPCILIKAQNSESSLPFDVTPMHVTTYPYPAPRDENDPSIIACQREILRNVERLLAIYSQQGFCENIVYPISAPTVTTMEYYHVDITVKGSIADCETGRALTIYTGSALVDSSIRPVLYKDRVKTQNGICSHRFYPCETVLNQDEFTRNPILLEYTIQAPSKYEKLFFTGEIITNAQLRKDKGGIGLHIPYFTKYVTMNIDISSVPFIREYGGNAVLSYKDEEGCIQSKKISDLQFYDNSGIYCISVRDVPTDSNIYFNWVNIVN